MKFDSVDYEPRGRPPGDMPVWILRLRDADGREVAAVTIDGTNGRSSATVRD